MNDKFLKAIPLFIAVVILMTGCTQKGKNLIFQVNRLASVLQEKLLGDIKKLGDY